MFVGCRTLGLCAEQVRTTWRLDLHAILDCHASAGKCIDIARLLDLYGAKYKRSLKSDLQGAGLGGKVGRALQQLPDVCRVSYRASPSGPQHPQIMVVTSARQHVASLTEAELTRFRATQ